MDEHWVQEVQSIATFPLPFCVLFLLSSGVLAWATNLHGLHLHMIDGPSVPHLDRSALPTTRLPGSKLVAHCRCPHHIDRSIDFSSTARHSVFPSGSYNTARPSTMPNVDVFKYLPAVRASGLVIGLVCPFDVLELREREKPLLCVAFPTFLFHET
jgi:hypothetical protein